MAYHLTLEVFLDSIAKEGLKLGWHPSVAEAPVIFVEPDLAGVEPYFQEGAVVLRFKTPGFGESVIFGGSVHEGHPPEPPLVGRPGDVGVIPPERLQILREGRFTWLIDR